MVALLEGREQLTLSILPLAGCVASCESGTMYSAACTAWMSIQVARHLMIRLTLAAGCAKLL